MDRSSILSRFEVDPDEEGIETRIRIRRRIRRRMFQRCPDEEGIETELPNTQTSR